MKISSKLATLFLCILLCPLFSLAQTKKALDAYADYFKLPRESLFIHTNKTTYLTGEEVWFKIYAYDRKNNLPSTQTTNIYFGLYDKKGQQLKKKLILSKNGVAQGNIMIDSTFTSGDYYLKADTRWMKNFKENDQFIQHIKVLNPLDDDPKVAKRVDEYDVQFLPEGGHMVYDVKSNIGFKIINSAGKGVKCSGIIVDSNGTTVVSFKSNFLGLGKFSFHPISGETYTAKVQLNEVTEIERNIERIQKNGIVISVNTLDSEVILINLTTNEQTFASITDKTFQLLIHKDGSIKSIPIVFDTMEKRISLPKKDLNTGINIITLLNDKEKPVLERIFFNDFGMQEPKLSIREFERTTDSITYQLSSNVDLQNDLMNLSLSVLPSQSISYNPKHTLHSALLLKPYLKGTIETPSYYFTNPDRKKKFELDVLLVTQGWSRYSWDNIFHFPPKKYYNFEHGIEIKGSINANISDTESLFMYPTENHESFFIDINESGKFQLLNFYPQRGETFSFSAYSKKGKTKKPGLAISLVQNMAKDQIEVPELKEAIQLYVNNNINIKNFITKERELLDEIVIDAKLQERKKRRQYLLPFRGKLKEITKEEVTKHTSLADFLNFNGFQVTRNIDGTYSIVSLRSGNAPVIFFLDNIEMNDQSALLGRSLYAFEDVYIDQNSTVNNFGISRGEAEADGNGGRNGFGFRHVIKLFSRRNSLYVIDRSKDFQQFIKVNYGFEPVKEYYAPKYLSYTIQPFKDYGTIDWRPEVILEKNTPVIFSTVNTNLEEISFHIEGMSTSGTLVSQTIKVSTPRKGN